MTLRAFSLVLLMLGATTTGCKKQEPRPEEVLKAFLADLQFGRAKHAWLSLTEQTQKELLKRHHTLTKADGEKATEKPETILFSELGLVVLAAPENIVVVSPIGNEVRLRATVKGGKSAELYLRKESGGWKIDLLKSLPPAPSLTQSLTHTATPSALQP